MNQRPRVVVVVPLEPLLLVLQVIDPLFIF